LVRVGIAASRRVKGGLRRVARAVERVSGVDAVVYADGRVEAGVRVVRCEDPGSRMVADLLDGELDAAVRGAVPAACVKELVERLGVGFTGRSTVLERDGGFTLLTPVGIDEGWEVGELVRLGELAVDFCRRLGVEEPRVAVVSSGRLEDVGRHPRVDEWLAVGELAARLLRERGLRAEHVGILVERAVDRDVLLFTGGVLGNLAFRALSLVAGFRSHGAPVLSALSEGLVFVDTSRAQRSSGYARALRLAARLAGG
jgi:putative methanogen marker protein 4